MRNNFSHLEWFFLCKLKLVSEKNKKSTRTSQKKTTKKRRDVIHNAKISVRNQQHHPENNKKYLRMPHAIKFDPLLRDRGITFAPRLACATISSYELVWLVQTEVDCRCHNVGTIGFRQVLHAQVYCYFFVRFSYVRTEAEHHIAYLSSHQQNRAKERKVPSHGERNEIRPFRVNGVSGVNSRVATNKNAAQKTKKCLHMSKVKQVYCQNPASIKRSDLITLSTCKHLNALAWFVSYE